MKKILVVFGTRPEAIKMAPLVKKLKDSKKFETKVMVTGHHRQMLDQVLNLFEIVPDFDLNLMKINQDLTDITNRVLEGCRETFLKFRPDLVCVHGDTTTSFATSLACFYHQIKVAHIEAGLRTYNIHSPFPEEMNRQFVSRLANYHFAPTAESKNNLLKENVEPSGILECGNTVIDALYYAVKVIKTDPLLEKQLKDRINQLGKFKLDEGPFILITGHRRENFGVGFSNICEAILVLAKKYPDYKFLYPVHFNPNVREVVMRLLGSQPNIFLPDPLDYLPFVYLMMNSTLILTDSGGIQEEAPSLGKPVIVMRDNTERPEALKSGMVKLVGTSVEKIVNTTDEILQKISNESYQTINSTVYGNGTASEQIVSFLESKL